ncbi:MAG: class I SAM-dependent methyltransferase [Sedimentisphaerales bacterium]|nr:class I SAM-dependent methyltransferase [Sedimentisphaerales bacterium]
MGLPDPRIAYFDSLAAGWDQQEPGSRAMTDQLSAHAGLLALRPGQMLLEVGCGTGKTTGWLAGQVAPGRVTAVDFSPAMIERARAKNLDARFLCLDVCRDELDEAAFDVVLCFHSFPHFRDPAAALGNLARSLRPGGRILIMHLAGSAHINAFHADLDGPVRGDALPSAARWDTLLRQSRLALKELIDQDNLFFLEAAVESDPGETQEKS